MPATREKEEALENGLVQTIFRPCARFLVEKSKLQAGERLLDIGCGSGIVARVALDLHPTLGAAHGFDFEQAAVDVAQRVASRRGDYNKIKFWRGDATMAKDYHGPWEVCIAQHVIQHAPEMLTPMRQSLSNGGRAIVATWPATSKECPAYSFLYSAAGEGEKPIGMSLAALSEKVQKAGFHEVKALVAEIDTPYIAPKSFLRQYLEGKLRRPANIDGYLDSPEAEKLAAEKALHVRDDGTMQFRIVMHVVVASSRSL